MTYGFKLIKRTESGTYPYFCSSDNANASYRPRLRVDYTPPAVLPTSVAKVKALLR
jgi:hypothetical protein